MYQIENNQVFYTKPLELRLRLKTAHVQHFQSLKDRTISAELTRTITQYGCWHRLNNLMAKDDRTVWFGNQPVPGADPESFVYYHGGECAWGQDKNQLYCFFEKGRHNIKTIKSKNPASFGFFDFPETIGYLRMYAFDEHHVYHLGQRVRKADPNAFRPLTKKIYSLDRQLITHSYPSSAYYTSENNLYYHGKPIVGADGYTAHLVSLEKAGQAKYLIAYDQHHFYYEGVPVHPRFQAMFDLIPPPIIAHQNSLAQKAA